MFQKLRYRIIALSIGLLLLVYAISSFAIYSIVSKTVMQALNLELAVAVHQVTDGNRFKPNPPGVTTLVASTSSANTIIGHGDNEADTITRVENAVEKQPSADGRIHLAVDGRQYQVRYVLLTTGTKSAFKPFVAAFVDDTGELVVLSKLRNVLLLVGAFGIVGTTMSGFFLAGRMLRPIKSAWQRQLEFVSDASHELRTPLAVIQSNLGIVMEHTDESVLSNLEWLNNIHGESRRLSKLVQNLLTLARSDSEKMPISQDQVGLNGVVEHVYELYQTVCELKEVRLEIDTDADVPIVGDSERLHQLLVILLDNALKFTDAGGIITIRATRVKNRAMISVVDTGQGIAKENLSRVFDRFFTVDPARTHEAMESGTGLGLSIAKWIVRAHGGSIQIDSAGIGHGAAVRVELPVRAA